LEEAPAEGRRLCPTRTNDAHALIEQWITPGTCLERQRRSYHKCFSCKYQGLSAASVLPTARPAPVPKLARPAAKVESPKPLRKRARVSKTA